MQTVASSDKSYRTAYDEEKNVTKRNIYINENKNDSNKYKKYRWLC